MSGRAYEPSVGAVLIIKISVSIRLVVMKRLFIQIIITGEVDIVNRYRNAMYVIS